MRSVCKFRFSSISAVGFAFVLLGLLVQVQAAELTPATIRMDFIIGGKHAPWFVALEKGFYAKRGLNVTIQSSTGSADTVRTIGAGGADFGFADIATTIVARSRGTPIQTVAQFGYVRCDHHVARRHEYKTIEGPGRKDLCDQPRAGPMVFDAGVLPDQ